MKKFFRSLWINLSLVVICSCAGAYAFFMQEYIYLVLIVPLIITEIIVIIRQYKSGIDKITFMFNSMECDDFSFKFNEKIGTNYQQDFNKSLNRIKSLVENANLRNAERNIYFHTIIDNVRTGILTINDQGCVFHVNEYLLKLLGVNLLTHVSQLDRIGKGLKEIVETITPDQKCQYDLVSERGELTLSITASLINYQNQELKIISINDINNELNEKETESWIKLTRILTHEIMNSLAPINSLSESLLSLANRESSPLALHQNQQRITGKSADIEEIKNGLEVINSTSKNLENFVKIYREFTFIPVPNKSLIYLNPLLKNLCNLIIPNELEYSIECNPQDLMVFVDETLFSRVITNILKNAVYAVNNAKYCEADGKKIELQAYLNNLENVVIDISNSGDAVPADISENIFTPFFTTKSNGSGIGLSISRQIMLKHGGTLRLTSNRHGKVCFSIEVA